MSEMHSLGAPTKTDHLPVLHIVLPTPPIFSDNFFLQWPPFSNRPGVYKGELDARGVPNGIGELAWPDGARYVNDSRCLLMFAASCGVLQIYGTVGVWASPGAWIVLMGQWEYL
jgi:hypothetical protein